MMEILQPGLLTTVQDGGRWGFQQYGVPVCGAMDWSALARANLLAGNAMEEAALEITGLGPVFRFLKDNCFALAGADCAAVLNSTPLESGRAYFASAGDILRMGALKRGFRACLAVSGGFDLPEVMGSRSTCLSAGFGGYRGRALQKGDRLAFRSPQLWLHGLTERRLPEDYDPAQPVRVVLGPQADAFSEETLARFFSAEYRLGPKSDRMGARLEGPPLPLQPGKTANIISDGIAMGSIQVPNGQPILMLADRQTTGGYVKLGAVITADLPLAAQKRPGDTIRFQRCTVEEAQMLLRRLRRQLHHAAQALDDPARW